jgi:hypothetical protein
MSGKFGEAIAAFRDDDPRPPLPKPSRFGAVESMKAGHGPIRFRHLRPARPARRDEDQPMDQIRRPYQSQPTP